MEKIIITPLIYAKIDEIILVLYNDEYYGFMDTAKSYGDAILNFILTIPQQKRKHTINARFANTIAGINMIEELSTTLLLILMGEIISYKTLSLTIPVNARLTL